MSTPSEMLPAGAGGGQRQAVQPSLIDWVLPLRRHWLLLLVLPLLAGLSALGASYLVAPTFTARTTFLPPQQHGGSASALASLGALASLAGGGIKTSGDQYVTLMQSDKVADRLIDEFKLMDVYRAEFRSDARLALATKVRIEAGKKDGVITVEVDDHDPKRAAALANGHVDELRRIAGELALTEAQQRRVFFESELKQTRDRLAKAQQELQASGFNPGALRAEPKAAGELYARLRADVTGAELRLQMMRGTLAETTLEVQQQQALVSTLRRQLAGAENSSAQGQGPDYISRYREFKYQEALFELVSKQYELARLDEAREGALIQVIDAATPPERRSKPKRTNIAVVTTLAAFLLLSFVLMVRSAWRGSAAQRQGSTRSAD